MHNGKLRILAFIDWYLPGTKAGGPVRSLYSLSNLLKSDVEFGIVTRNVDLGSTATYQGITADTWTRQQGQLVYYFSTLNLTNENLLELIEAYNPDLLYVNSFWSAKFSINLVRLKASKKVTQPLLLAPRGMLGQGAMSLKSFKKLVYLFFAKKANWYGAVNFHATQKVEEDDILKQFGNAKIYIAPNVNAGVEHQNVSVKKKNEIKLVYLSRIARVKNLHFALQCLIKTPASIKVTYTIYGNAEDNEYVNECKKIVEQLPSNVIVEWKGELEFYEVQQTLRKYEVLFLPTLNENFGHSIVEAFLCGCGVIISDQTPWRALRKSGCGADLPLTSADPFLEEICRIAAMDAEAFRDLSLASNKYIRARIDQEKIKKQYLQMFNDCTQNRSK